MQASPGRIPVRDCRSIIAQTVGESFDLAASTCAAGTGFTGADSRTFDRPNVKPFTSRSVEHGLPGEDLAEPIL
jgi:hypothetical protein